MMVSKELFLIPLFLIFASLAALLSTSYGKKEHKIRSVSINGHLIYVEVADTSKEKALGLSGRTNLAKDSGMLFIFPKPDIYTFWMKEMNFPLDFIWINGDTVVDLTEGVPPPQDKNGADLPLYKPKEAVDKVLEINAGEVKRLDIKIGDKVVYNSRPN